MKEKKIVGYNWDINEVVAVLEVVVEEVKDSRPPIHIQYPIVKKGKKGW